MSQAERYDSLADTADLMDDEALAGRLRSLAIQQRLLVMRLFDD
ncbi:MAG: hypothetical protein ABIP17_11030 [Ilumatobacteraceae bacterium]